MRQVLDVFGWMVGAPAFGCALREKVSNQGGSKRSSGACKMKLPSPGLQDEQVSERSLGSQFGRL